MIDQLLEKYLTAVKQYGKTYEIFKNPNQREIKELLAIGYGLRIFADFSKKNIYMASGDIMHKHMLKSPELKKDIPVAGNWWSKYWYSGEGADEIFMFDVGGNMKRVNSDSLYNLMFLPSVKISPSDKVEVIARVDSLLEKDFNWLAKYFLDPKEVKDYIKDFRKKL